MHHPLHELADRRAVRQILADHADIVLRGHLHDTEVAEWIEPLRRIRELAAGCLYEGGLADKYGNSCELVRVTLSRSGRPICADVRFRSFSPRGGHWFDDDSLYATSRGGRYHWTFNVVPPGASNPFSPWMARVEQCFGREQLLSAVDAALDDKRSIWLAGDWRFGKTMTLLACGRRLQERGKIVRLVSGRAPGHVSPNTLVEKLTGDSCPTDPDEAAERLSAWVKRIAASDSPPVILIDEIDLTMQLNDVHFHKALRELIGELCIVVASRQTPQEIFGADNEPLISNGRLDILWVGLLEPGGAESTIRLGLDYLRPGDDELMKRWSGSHSFFLQLLGSALVEARRAGTDIERVLGELKGQVSLHFRQLRWSTISLSQRVALVESARGVPAHVLALKERGLVTNEGKPFGEFLAAWLRGDIES